MNLRKLGLTLAAVLFTATLAGAAVAGDGGDLSGFDPFGLASKCRTAIGAAVSNVFSDHNHSFTR
jgi:hypothetical protein